MRDKTIAISPKYFGDINAINKILKEKFIMENTYDAPINLIINLDFNI